MLSRVKTINVTARHASCRRQAGGFSLVELMVALVAGLVVVLAVLALVVSIMKSNRQTLQSTRLNQELRATLGVIANDLRRARSVADPLTIAKRVGGNPYKGVDTSTAGCIRYAYDDRVGGRCHVIRAAANRIELVEAAPNAGTGECTTTCAMAGGVRLGSEQVEVTALTITPATTSTTPPQATDESIVRQFTLTVSGRLIDQDTELNSITRTMSQTVYVRSIGTGI